MEPWCYNNDTERAIKRLYTTRIRRDLPGVDGEGARKVLTQNRSLPVWLLNNGFSRKLSTGYPQPLGVIHRLSTVAKKQRKLSTVAKKPRCENTTVAKKQHLNKNYSQLRIRTILNSVLVWILAEVELTILLLVNDPRKLHIHIYQYLQNI